MATSANRHDTLWNRGIAARVEKVEWDDWRRSSSRTVSRSGLRSGSAENGNAHWRATLILARGRIELENGAVCSSGGVRSDHCIAERDAMVAGQDRARRFCQRAEHARRLRKRRIARLLLIVGRTIAVANDERTARRG